MKKQELVWVIVRLIGLILIYNGIQAFFGLLGTFVVASQVSDISTANSQIGFGKTIFFTIMQQLLVTGLYLGVGYYTLTDGAVIFGLLDAEEPTNKIAEELEETSLKLDEN
jgi:hypothetical protein